MKKNNLIIVCASALCFCFLLFTSCEKENVDETELMPLFDCEDLELNVGDTCTTAAIPMGIVNADCE